MRNLKVGSNVIYQGEVVKLISLESDVATIKIANRFISVKVTEIHPILSEGTRIPNSGILRS